MWEVLCDALAAARWHVSLVSCNVAGAAARRPLDDHAREVLVAAPGMGGPAPCSRCAALPWPSSVSCNATASAECGSRVVARLGG